MHSTTHLPSAFCISLFYSPSNCEGFISFLYLYTTDILKINVLISVIHVMMQTFSAVIFPNIATITSWTI